MKIKELPKDKSFITILGKVPVLLSAPHNVMQVRNGKKKVSELGTGALILHTQEYTNSYAIIKTKCMGIVGKKDDDANFEPNHPYKQHIEQMVKQHKLKALVDIHTMKKTRVKMVNIGINGGKNIQHNEELLQKVVREFEAYGFMVFIDQPFFAPEYTVSGEVAQLRNIFCLQIEINSKYLHYKDARNKRQLLAHIMSNVVNILNEEL